MIKTIDEAFDLIYSFVDYSMSHAKDVDRNAFSLQNIRILLNKLGNPQNAYPVIHVAGTKGKGSVCAMLAAALQNAGLKTGLYTSPHLIRFNERIMADGRMISDDAVIRLTERLTEFTQPPNRISSFELMTAMAFEYFKEQNVDIAVVETGLGGRLDATNVVDPILSVITSISIDHTGFLGDTIEKISAEKAGIIKPKVPVICAYQPYPEAYKVLKEAAEKNKSPWFNVSERYQYINMRASGLEKDSLMIWKVEDRKLMERWCSNEALGSWEPEIIKIPLAGSHQMHNTAAVYAAINKIKARYNNFDMKKAVSGISGAFWPCRFECLCESKPLFADGAHNSDSIEKLCVLLDRYCGTKKIKFIFGASEDKDLKKMIFLLAPHVNEFIMTRSTHPRAAVPSLLASIASGIGRKSIITDSLEEAYALYEKDTEENVCYVAAGSLFVAGGIRALHMQKDASLKYFTLNE